MSENETLPRVVPVGDIPPDDPVFYREEWGWVLSITNRSTGQSIVIPPGETAQLPQSIDWCCESMKAGDVRPLVQLDSNGVPQFVRAIGSEKPGVICVAFRRKDGKIEVLLTEEFRAPMSMFYLHSAMGFSEESIKNRLEDAIRELTEEFGYRGSITFIEPTGDPKICANPTNTRTNDTYFVFAELSGESWQKPAGDGHETFRGFRFYSMSELFEILECGSTTTGASVREGPHSAALIAFLAQFRHEIFTYK